MARGKPDAQDKPASQRVDRWLWHARIVKTRDDAQTLIAKGRVRRNRQPLSAASDLVRAGDVLTIRLDRAIRVVEVIGFAERRGSAEDARQLVRAIEAGESQDAATETS